MNRYQFIFLLNLFCPFLNGMQKPENPLEVTGLLPDLQSIVVGYLSWENRVTLKQSGGTDLHFSVNGHRLISPTSHGSINKKICVWDLGTNQSLREIDHDLYSVDHLILHKDKIVAMHFSKVKMWDINSGSELSSVDVKGQIYYAPIILGNKLYILTMGVRDRFFIETLSLDSGELADTYIIDADFAAIYDNKYITVRNNIINVYDIENKFLLRIIEDPSLNIYRRKVLINSTKIVTISDDKTAKIWDLDTGKLLYAIENFIINNDTNDWQGIIDNKLISCTTHKPSYDKTKTIRIWDLNSGKLINTFEDISNIEISGNTIMFTDREKWGREVKIVDINTSKLLATLKGHESNVDKIKLIGNKIFSISLDNTIKIWENQAEALKALLKVKESNKEKSEEEKSNQKSSEDQPRICTNCQQESKEKLKRCAACRQVYYCSVKCQKAHWKNGHKETCAQNK